MMVMNDAPYVIYLANIHTSELFKFMSMTFSLKHSIFVTIGELLNTSNLDREGRIKPKRRFSLREINRTIRM